MLQSYQRLSGRDIQYILRRGQKYYGQLFIFRTIPQYARRPYTQWSVQIPLKLDKRASMRNLLKRRARAIFAELYHDAGPTKQYKIFIFVNKNAVGTWRNMIVSSDKTTIVEARSQACYQDFSSYIRNLGIKGEK